jgi:hypothetical protein
VATARRGQRPGRVGGHELDQHPLRLGHDPGAEAVPCLEHRGHPRAVPAVGQEQVEEAGAGDLDPVGGRAEPPAQLLPQPLRDLARRLAACGREQHRGVGRVVAQFGLGGTLQLRGRVARLAVAQAGGGVVNRAAELE